MNYADDSIIKTEAGLYLTDQFYWTILDRVELLAVSGREEDSAALFNEFDVFADRLENLREELLFSLLFPAEFLPAPV